MTSTEWCSGRLCGGEKNPLWPGLSRSTYACTLPPGHQVPSNHETWIAGQLVAEWADESPGAWNEGEEQ